VLDKVEQLSGNRFEVLYAVGGGVQNELLCRWTAEALKRPLSAGPAEGTVIGNIGMQLISLGAFSDLTELRACIRHSFPPVLYGG
jgi:rhamnulokinase